MLARMHSQSSDSCERMFLLCYCLVDVLTHYILKYLITCQRLALKIIPRNPEPWRVVVLIIGDADLVSPEIWLSGLLLLLDLRYQKPIDNLLRDFFLHDLLYALFWPCIGCEELFFGVRKSFVFGQGALPFPSKVCQLISCFHKHLWSKQSFLIEVFSFNCEFGLDELGNSLKKFLHNSL